jgi:hypothetical protein
MIVPFVYAYVICSSISLSSVRKLRYVISWPFPAVAVAVHVELHALCQYRVWDLQLQLVLSWLLSISVA